jgi:hypothetical protein
MWYWFVFWVVILFVLLSGSSWFGYRRSYYGAGAAFAMLAFFVALFFIAVVFAGPYWGWYGYWW